MNEKWKDMPEHFGVRYDDEGQPIYYDCTHCGAVGVCESGRTTCRECVDKYFGGPLKGPVAVRHWL